MSASECFSPKVKGEKYPGVAACQRATTWIKQQACFGLATNTLDAYARGLEGYLQFSAAAGVAVEAATKAHVAAYVHSLMSRKKARRQVDGRLEPEVGLSNATLQQRMTVIRLFYNYLVEEGVFTFSPVGRIGKGGTRSLLPRYKKLPWIPNDEQWLAVLEAARQEPLRNRLMLALSYDAALRREELCSLATGDFDPALRLLRVRAETTKNRQERVVPYSETTGALFAAYLQARRALNRKPGTIFLSESRRNHAEPLSIWTWSKTITNLAQRAGVKQFTTHTPRHLRLTDLARAGWDIHEIAAFAGHQSVQTTLLYIHLSGRELADKLANGMAQIHRWRLAALEGVPA